MSVEKIVQRILEDARAEAQKILKEAEREAARISADSEVEAERVRRSVLKEAQGEAERRRLEILAEARLKARQRVLAARRQAIDRVFEEALRRLQGLPPERYIEVLKRLILEGTETGREEIVLSQEDRAKLPPSFLDEINEELRKRGRPGELKLSEEARALGGGVVLRGSRVEVNASFPALVEGARRQLEIEAAKILFGDAGGKAE